MNEKELFDITEQDSPRLAWIKKHAVQITVNKNIRPGNDDEDEFGNEIRPVECRTVTRRSKIGFGDTEDEAIHDWALKNKVRMWGEENL